MTAHWANPEVQRRGCAALLNLTTDPENKARAARAGALEAALAAMRTFRILNPDVQGLGCDLVRTIVRGSRPARARAVEAGSAEEAAAALRAHPDSAEVIAKACAMLRTLCGEGEGPGAGALGDLAAKRAVDAGAVAAVVSGMGAQTASAAVQAGALGALLALRQRCAPEEFGKKADAAGMPAAVASALKEHAGHEVIRQAAHALCSAGGDVVQQTAAGSAVGGVVGTEGQEGPGGGGSLQ